LRGASRHRRFLFPRQVELGRHPMDAPPSEVEHVPARLGLWDVVSLIVGIIVGVGVFEAPSRIFREAPSAWAGLGVWILGGALVLAGAFCFAELASTYPRSGGEYVYLTRAFGPLVGYLFAWAQLTVIRPCSIGWLAYVFALYAGALVSGGPHGILLLAIFAVVVLT